MTCSRLNLIKSRMYAVSFVIVCFALHGQLGTSFEVKENSGHVQTKADSGQVRKTLEAQNYFTEEIFTSEQYMYLTLVSQSYQIVQITSLRTSNAIIHIYDGGTERSPILFRTTRNHTHSSQHLRSSSNQMLITMVPKTAKTRFHVILEYSAAIQDSECQIILSDSSLLWTMVISANVNEGYNMEQAVCAEKHKDDGDGIGIIQFMIRLDYMFRQHCRNDSLLIENHADDSRVLIPLCDVGENHFVNVTNLYTKVKFILLHHDGVNRWTTFYAKHLSINKMAPETISLESSTSLPEGPSTEYSTLLKTMIVPICGTCFGLICLVCIIKQTRVLNWCRGHHQHLPGREEDEDAVKMHSLSQST